MVESGTTEKRKKFNYSSTYQKKKIIILKKRDVWNAFPSHNIPPMFNYGDIYHFNVQSVDEMRLLTRTRHGHRYGRLGVGKGHSILDHRIGVRPKKKYLERGCISDQEIHAFTCLGFFIVQSPKSTCLGVF